MIDKPDQPDVVKALAKIPGAESSTRIDARWWLVATVVFLIVLLAVLVPDPYLRIILFVRDGIWISVTVTVIAFVLTLVAGMVGGLGRLSKNPVVYGFFTTYVEIIRGIPLLVQLIWWYFAFPVVIQSMGKSLEELLGVSLPFLSKYQANALWMAIIGLVFCYGAYMSEIYRAGIQSIPKGQMEAARSLGMSHTQAMAYVILPQAIRVILPPIGNEFIALLKDSSLVSVVAVADLTRRGREFMASTFMPLPTWIMVALLYLVLTLISSLIVGWIEKRTQIER